MATTMTVQCPSCDTSFPVDPDKVPEMGVRTQCTICETIFRVDPPAPEPWETEGDAVPDAAADLMAGAAGMAGGLEEAEAPVWEAEGAPTEVEDAVAEIEDAAVGPFGAEEDSLPMPADEPLPMLAAEPVAEEPVAPEPVAEAPDADLDTSDSDFGAEWSSEGGDDWVVETEERSGAVGEVEVERLDTVEERVRSFQEEEVLPEEGISPTAAPDPGADVGGFEDFMTADEVMLTDMDLDLDVAAAEAAPAVAFEPEPEAAPEFEPEPEATAAPEPAPAPEAAPQPTGFQFGRRDPHDKARRLARVLVSDMITYNPDRHNQALEQGTLKEDFQEEIDKSWAEYVEQVGRDMAESTTYWTDALNEILAKGQPLF